MQNIEYDMKVLYGFLMLFFCFLSKIEGQGRPDIRADLQSIRFQYEEVKGIGHEAGVTRRDPSDVILVGDTYYVYYTKVYGRSPGYWGTLWYATSKDEGHTWEEQGEILGVGREGWFDAQATFTPNILYANGKYYLYYTGVKPTPGNEEGAFENNSVTDITAIGVAVADAPGGPFIRVTKSPILKVSVEPEKFDSYRVDDAALIYRNGLYWLYYKGRSRIHGRQGPLSTQMGVAYAREPTGPFIKYDKPLLPDSHEVLIWPQGPGVAALASKSSTIEYAADGIDFLTNRLGQKVENRPLAPGAYRPDLTKPVTEGQGLDWGISMVHNGPESYLIRYEVVRN